MIAIVDDENSFNSTFNLDIYQKKSNNNNSENIIKLTDAIQYKCKRTQGKFN